MRARHAAALFAISAFAVAADKGPPTGTASNEAGAITATVLDAAAIHQETGTDLTGPFVVMRVTLTPKPGQSLDIKLDDFLLRDSGSFEHTGPVLAGQVLGTGGIVLHAQKLDAIGTERPDPTLSAPTKSSAKGGATEDQIKALRGKILVEKATTSPVTGLLFFPIEVKKPKNLDLVWGTPRGKLHVAFR